VEELSPWHGAPNVKIIVVGAAGRLGAALMRQWQQHFELLGFSHADLDIGDFDAVRERLRGERFDWLINCAAQTNVDRCETDKAEAFRLNGEAPGVLADLCSRKGARMIHISTDYVFDGSKTQPYSEQDPARPISVYGESKLEGERCVTSVDPRHWIVRVSWVFGPDRPSFVDGVIQRAMTNDRVEAIADKFSAPTYTNDLAKTLSGLVQAEASDAENNAVGGVLHFCNDGECSWQEYAQYALDCCREAGVALKATTVAPLRLAQMKNFIARRPVYTVLSTGKFTKITGTAPRSWREAVRDYITHSYSNL
jgi:dTDP-4-dehydrorhamnose reductase